MVSLGLALPQRMFSRRLVESKDKILKEDVIELPDKSPFGVGDSHDGVKMILMSWRTQHN